MSTVWRWEPDRRYNFFFSPPAHLCRHILQGQLFRSGLPWRTPSLRKWDPTNNPKTKSRKSNPAHLSIIAHAGANFSCHLWHAWGYGGPILLNLGSSRGPLRDRGWSLEKIDKRLVGPVCVLRTLNKCLWRESPTVGQTSSRVHIFITDMYAYPCLWLLVKQQSTLHEQPNKILIRVTDKVYLHNKFISFQF